MIRTTCPYCGVGCGVLAAPDGAGGITIKGDPDHPANFGRLCSKGAALDDTVDLDGRLLHPMVHGTRASWDDALGTIASRLSATIRDHGPDSVAFYVSGQMLTEDYYVANKLMKGFIGSANIDTNSRLCMASSVAGHKRAFGSDTVPGTYADLEQADLIVLVGSNLAWCHPVLYQRIVAAKAANPAMKLINIDPRRTASSDLADLHLSLAPGSDVALFNHLLARIADCGAVNDAYVRAHVTGFEDAVAAARATDRSVTGLTQADIDAFVDLWIGTEKVVTVYSQGVNQSVSGSDKVNAILNCHLATGRIGKPGMGPFSVTGQPNAMGGREVGGLANMLACHMDIETPAHRQAVREFWSAPALPDAAGLKAVDLFRAVGDGRIKALWIICTNPAVSMPDADAVRDAIAGCDFVVVSDLTADTDTARLAHVLLPATGWGEKDGTVTNSERRISRQRALLPPPGEARADWAILAEVGRRMGWPAAFDFQSPAEVFREHAALSGVAGAQGLDFDIFGLSDLDDGEYDALAPVQWPVTTRDTRCTAGRFFGEGNFFTPDRKARMLALTPRPPAQQPSAARPFVMNTGRIRDQWHTMTRTGKSPRLGRHLAEPFAEIHPRDAVKLGLKPADLVQIDTDHGRALMRALITDRVQPGHIFVPMHWTGVNASAARIDALVPATVDPVSGQPESKAAVAAMTRFNADWYGFAVSTRRPDADCAYWAVSRATAGWRMELAGTTGGSDWEATARQMLHCPDADAIKVDDPQRGTTRIAFMQDGRLCAALFIAPTPVAVSREYLVDALDGPAPDVLSGRPGVDRPDAGPTLCSCMNVGINTIIEGIETQGLMTVEAIGTALRAGTNCGSCRPEIAALLAQMRVRVAAE
ncbi:nitrate reductase [Pseudoruegeria sp. SK021]|uniref:nitrate reductase n=1 Tax=Pseudoruegeria sp. SK021 TaxID=1933035 RepID=UPI000A24A156|nr:nitrate reductase [Pseudoruegeria sp. SK021]OSP56437.1 nitrate reductase [Pseudoruegeria sp. SK021]